MRRAAEALILDGILPGWVLLRAVPRKGSLRVLTMVLQAVQARQLPLVPLERVVPVRPALLAQPVQQQQA